MNTNDSQFLKIKSFIIYLRNVLIATVGMQTIAIIIESMFFNQKIKLFTQKHEQTFLMIIIIKENMGN